MSQLPHLLATGVDAYLKLVWLAPLGYGLIKEYKHMADDVLRPFYLFAVIFMLYCLTLDSLVWTVKGYFGGDCYNIAVSFMVMIVAYLYWQQALDKRKLIWLLGISILICTIILTFTVYFDFLKGVDLSGRIYAFKAKNSMGQILFVGAFVGIFLTWSQNKLLQVIYMLISACILIVIFAIKSRATIISIGVVILYFLLFYKNKKVRITLLVSLGLILSYAFLFSDLGSYVVDNFVFAGRNTESVDDLSSGRLSIIVRKLELVQNNWIGIGNTYLDSFPIAIYIQYGIIGCVIMGTFLLYLTRKIILLDKKDPISIITVVLFISFMVNCLFEALPPFGPGVKCFLLWMFLGFTLSEQYNNIIDSESRNEH